MSLLWWAPAHGAFAATSAVTQPRPPVTSSSFPEESQGAAPVDGDGLIPNPQTPTGQPISAPTSCTVEFDATSGDTAADVNTWIASNENTITTTTTVCLTGTFTSPIHVWSKDSKALLVLAPAPGQSATLDLGTAKQKDVDPNEYESDAGGISLVDSRSVEVYGLTIENYMFDGTAQTPSGILVEVRSDVTTTNQSTTPHLSACYLNGGSCSDIYLFDNTVENIRNTADEDTSSKSDCNNQNVDAYGIAVISAGSTDAAHALQHVVIEDNTVSATRTGQSETVTVNGDIEDFLVYGNTIHDTDNIGIDTIGWEQGKFTSDVSQARHGLVADNTVYDVDTYSNSAYGRWDSTAGVCEPIAENAAGIYDDGAAYIWIDQNDVWNTDQGIDVDVEKSYGYTDYILVSWNTVEDDPGTSAGDPSLGETEPPGVSGQSQVAGHAYVGLYVEEFGKGSKLTDVYVHDNTIQNQSQWFLDRKNDGSPVVDLGGATGTWSDVQVWHNTIIGLDTSTGSTNTDKYNALLEVDQQPKAGVVINCNDYENLTTNANSVNGNFALPTNNWLTLAQWKTHNKHGWDADSMVGGFSSKCPANTIQ